MSESAKLRRPAVDLDEFERRLFATAPAERPIDDPLAELSRIVGKSDPFKGLFAAPASTARPAGRVSEPAFAAPALDNFGRKTTGIAAPLGGQDRGAGQGPAMVLGSSLGQDRSSFALHDNVVNFAAPHAAEPALQAASAAPQVQLSPQDAFAPHNHPAQSYSNQDFAAQDFAPHAFEDEAENPAHEQAEAEFYGHHAGEPAASASRAAEPRQRSLRNTTLLMSIIVAGMVGVAAAIGYNGQLKKAASGALPVIKAASTPIKVEPARGDNAAAGGATSEATAPATSATPMPQPAAEAAKPASKVEQPLEIVQIPGQAPIRVHRIIPLSGEQAQAIMEGQPTPRGTDEPDLPQARPVKTVSVRPDGSLLNAPVKAAVPVQTAQAATPQAAAQPAAPTSMAQLAAQAAAQPPVAAPVSPPVPKVPLMVAAAPARTPAPAAVQPTDTAPVAPKATTPKATMRANAPAPKPVAPKPAAPAAKPAADQPLSLNPVAEGKAGRGTKADPIGQLAAQQAAPTRTATSAGTFAVQLAAPATEAEARAAAVRLQGQYGDSLNGHALSVRKADIGGRTVYRVRVGNLPREEAVSICENLKSAGGQCFISK